MVKLKEEKSGTYKEILDDTGYLSSYLGLTYLIKSSRATGIENLAEARNKKTLNFMKSRLNHMEAFFKENLPAEDWPFFKLSIQLYRNMLDFNPITSGELINGWHNFQRLLYDNDLVITGYTRANSSSPWSLVEVPINEMDLPSYVVTRGCNAGLSNFNTMVSGKSPAASKSRSSTGTK